MEHLDAGVAQLDLLSVAQRLEWDLYRGGLVQAVCRARPVRQLRPAGPMVRVHVCVDNVGNPHAFRGGEGKVGIQIRLVRVDDGTLLERAATKQIGRAACFKVIVRLEDHVRASPRPVSMRSPLAFQSSTPSSMRCARNPCLRSRSTASTAITQYGPRQYATMSRRFAKSRYRFFSSASGME